MFYQTINNMCNTNASAPQVPQPNPVNPAFAAWFTAMKKDLATRSNNAFGPKECRDKMFRAYAYVDFSIRGFTPQQSADQYIVGLA